MLHWAQQFNIFCFLDNQQYNIAPHYEECLLAVGTKRTCIAGKNSLQDLDSFIQKGSWHFGHLSYELKNHIYPNTSIKEDKICFPHFFFFEPEIVIQIIENEACIDGENATDIYKAIVLQDVFAVKEPLNLELHSRLTKEEYISTIKKLQKHILLGDCYEINFCQEFFAEDVSIDVFSIYQKLMQISPNPFSAFYKLNDQYLLCASPERFLVKKGNKITAQPIKGTNARNAENAAADEALKNALFSSGKDRAENVMIVDLMRNDLSKICREGTVTVEELFGVYAFPQVHQMISTISGELRSNISFAEIIRAVFPMGSMTGAPKQKVMELIDYYEPSARGIFSGSVGYIDTKGDFDFNVVIRSIMYHAGSKYLSYQAGSGITHYSDPDLEWEECNLKVAAIKKVLAL